MTKPKPKKQPRQKAERPPIIVTPADGVVDFDAYAEVFGVDAFAHVFVSVPAADAEPDD